VVVLLALVVAMSFLSPLYRTLGGLMMLLQRAAPLVVLTCGQTFVLAAGGFDLSVGSIVTLVVIGCALLTGGDPSLTVVAIGAVVGIGFFVGLVNGIVVSRLKVPSIIATLGMLLSAKGFAMYWSGGSPAGVLPDNLRFFGRFAWRDVPLIGTLPVAVLILVAAVVPMAWLLHGTNFGRLILMIGDNPKAAELAGVPVRRIRAAAFVISAAVGRRRRHFARRLLRRVGQGWQRLRAAGDFSSFNRRRGAAGRCSHDRGRRHRRAHALRLVHRPQPDRVSRAAAFGGSGPDSDHRRGPYSPAAVADFHQWP
jgi:predicted ABC-type sugar transport system permease subunit